MINDLKVILGIKDNDSDYLLTLILERCIDYFVNYCHTTDTHMAESLIVDMAAYVYRGIKVENQSSGGGSSSESSSDNHFGLKQESYSGVSWTYDTSAINEFINKYTNDYSDSIVRQLKAHRHVITLD